MKRKFSIVNRQVMIAAIIIVVAGIMLAGGGKSEKKPEFLTEHEWLHYDCACDETISFGDDGHFAFYSDEGNPVGDSDLYDKYTYDSESGEVRLRILLTILITLSVGLVRTLQLSVKTGLKLLLHLQIMMAMIRNSRNMSYQKNWQIIQSFILGLIMWMKQEKS